MDMYTLVFATSPVPGVVFASRKWTTETLRARKSTMAVRSGRSAKLINVITNLVENSGVAFATDCAQHSSHKIRARKHTTAVTAARSTSTPSNAQAG